MLQELVQLASPKLPPGSMERKYYALLKKNVEKEKIKQILSCNDNYFWQIKYRLKWKLIDDLVSQTTYTGPSAYDEYAEAHKLFCVGKLLLTKQARQAGIEALEKSIIKAMKQGQIGLALEAAKPLATYYSAQPDGLKKFKYFQSIATDLLEKLKWETIARDHYNEIICHYSYHWNDNIAEKEFTYCDITAPYIDGSISTAISHYSTLYLAYISALDFEGLKNACDQAIKYFKRFDKPHRSAIYNAYLKKATALIHLQKYKEAVACTRHIIDISEHGKYTYCSAFYYQGIIGLHSGDIALCYNALDQVAPYRSELPSNFQEQFRILESYTALFSSRKFRIARFLNRVPNFDKDKAGANAAILIVQMLHYLKDANTHAYIDRCDALSRYTKRYLDGKKQILAKMLLEIPKGHFGWVSVEYRTRKFINNLTGQERELEIMPAEKIWQLIMEWLK